MKKLVLFCAISLAGLPTLAEEQSKLKHSVNIQSVFYADNTEFLDNPFREGETTFGDYVRLFGETEFSKTARIRYGLTANRAYGSPDGFDLVRPIFTFEVGTKKSRFILGTLDTNRSIGTLGPDRTTPHGLAPPMQMEQFSFSRPNELGLQWLLDNDRVQQDLWINWQQLNTPEHREKFDTGIVSRIKTRWPVDLEFQAHIVHYGGQLYSAGQPVSDSIAYGPGVILKPVSTKLGKVSAELYYLHSKHVPDRGQGRLTLNGDGFFLRTALEKNDYRLHAIAWRANDFIKSEGDPNYGALTSEGPVFRSVRDYAEAGLTKVFRLAKPVRMEVSARGYWIEHSFDYAYRILGVLDLRIPLGKKK